MTIQGLHVGIHCPGSSETWMTLMKESLQKKRKEINLEATTLHEYLILIVFPAFISAPCHFPLLG